MAVRVSVLCACVLLLAGCSCKPRPVIDVPKLTSGSSGDVTSRDVSSSDVSSLDVLSGTRQLQLTETNDVIAAEEMDIMFTSLFTSEQKSKLEHTAHAPGTKSRQKRKIVEKQHKRWPMPIFYKFHPSSTALQRSYIRGALSHWQDQTCILFFEVQDGASLATHHIIFTNIGSRCGSFVGMVDLPEKDPQIINLPDKCLEKFGTAVHEIGHALGLWHEHQRPDRDGHVTILNDNLVMWAHGNFDQAPGEFVDQLGLPYDYNSVMHYAATAGSINGSPTLRTRDELYQQNIGQRVELSFLDAKVVNAAYCKNMCVSRLLSRPCLHGGYQDPNRCDRCRCPDGMSGRYCGTVAPSTDAMCGGTIHLGSDTTVTLTSPGYTKGQPYNNKIVCNWLVKAPPEHTVELMFLGNFSVYCQKEVCFHWVEVKHQASFQNPGPRFCCSSRPERVVESEGRELLLIFKANWTAAPEKRLGFSAALHAKPPRSQWRHIPGIGGTIQQQRPLVNGRVTSQTAVTETSSTTMEPTTTQTTTTTTPTTTTTSPTTTTTTATTTTTKTTTGRTIMPTTTAALTTRNIRDFSWGPWSECSGLDTTTNSRFTSCSCGSCSAQTRRRLCGGASCPLRLARMQHRRCSWKCTQTDAVITFTGGLNIRQCPLCCEGFQPDHEGHCIKER